MRPGRMTLVVIAAMCAVLAVAPQTAVAGKKKRAYEGAVATQGVDGQPPTIQLKVQFKRKGGQPTSPTSSIAPARSSAPVAPQPSAAPSTLSRGPAVASPSLASFRTP